MKHQISKVALITALAFIGVGFAGTQQAKAGDCASSCESDDCTRTPAQKVMDFAVGCTYSSVENSGPGAFGMKNECATCASGCGLRYYHRTWQNKTLISDCVNAINPSSPHISGTTQCQVRTAVEISKTCPAGTPIGKP